MELSGEKKSSYKKEHKNCSDYIANSCICTDNCCHKELLSKNEGQRLTINMPRKVPIIDTSTIAKENTISPSVFHEAINVYNKQDLKDVQNKKKTNDENSPKLNKFIPYRNQFLKFVCVDDFKGLRIVKSNRDFNMGNIVPVKGVVDIETPIQNSSPQDVNNLECTETQNTSFLINKNKKIPETVNLEESDQLETLFNTIEGVSDFKSVKTENYILDAFSDEGFSCFSDQMQNSIYFSHEQSIMNSVLLNDNVLEPFTVNEEKTENVSNTATNSFDSVIKEDQDHIGQDDNTAHYVRRSSRKRKQIDILDIDGSDDDVWPSKRKSKGKEKQRRKCDFDSMEYLPGRQYGRMSKNQAVNPKRPYRYQGLNNFTCTTNSNCFTNSNSASYIATNSACKNCILNQWNESMMNDLLQADMKTKQKLLHKLRQRLLGYFPGYRRPEGWLSEILNQHPVS